MLQITLAALLCAWLAGCETRPGATQAVAPGPQRPPQRIVSLAPGVTEILFALGLGGRVVGVTDFCTYPPQAAELPRVGGPFNTNYETIARLEPDLAIILVSHSEAAQRLPTLGVPVLSVGSETMDELYASIRAISAAAGAQQQGEELIASMQNDLAAVATVAAEYPLTRALLCVGHSPGSLQDVYAAAPGSFLGDVLRLAGGENVAPGGAGNFPRVSKETIILSDPQAILVLNTSPHNANQAAEIALWAELGPLAAVRDGRVRLLASQGVNVAGPRVAELARLLAGLLHPEARERLGPSPTLDPDRGGS